MSEAKSPETSAWRLFEKLVARIERAAAPRNATVKSPDRIADVTTGTLREVDASIRFTIGTVPILITIECRKRRPRQDVTWIEQLSAKRLNVGAAQTIAVASAGVSKEAEAKALTGGIVVRQLETISREDIETWLVPQSFIEIFRRNRFLGNPEVEYYLSAADKDEVDLFPNPEKKGINAKMFINEDGKPLSLNDIWLHVQAQNNFYEDIPWPNGRAQKNICLQIHKDSLRLQTPVGPRNVATIKLQTELWYEVKEVPLDQRDFHQYTGSGGVEVQRAEYELQLSNLDLKLAMQSRKDSRDVSVEGAITLRKSVHD